MALKTAAANRKDINTAANGVALEHRHFAFIADVIAGIIADHDDLTPCADVVEAFAYHCARTNPKFNRARFVAACNAAKS